MLGKGDDSMDIELLTLAYDQKSHVTHFIAIIPLLQWFRTAAAISLGYACMCILINLHILSSCVD